MTEEELYKELGILTKDKDKWKEVSLLIWQTRHICSFDIYAGYCATRS